MSLISVKNLNFGYEGSADFVFEDASFVLDTDWKLGLVGRNGRGKTTLLKLLAGELPCPENIIKPAKTSYFPPHIACTSRTAAEIFDGSEEWELIRELTLLGVDADAAYRPFNTLSGGEKSKVMLAALFAGGSDFLLIDEPTTHLDSAGRLAVKEYLKTKKGFIVVSHDRELLDAVTDHTLAINRGDITVTAGNFSNYFAQKQLQDESERATNARLKSEITRLKDAAKRKSDWSDRTEKEKIGAPDKGFIGHKAAKVMKSAKVIESRQAKAIEQKSALLKNTEYTGTLKIQPLSHHSKTLLEIKNLSATFDKNTVFSGFNLKLQQGERVSLVGANGSGKSTIFACINDFAAKQANHDPQKTPATTGEIIMPSGLVISSIPQTTHHLFGTLADFIQNSKVDETLFRTILAKLDLDNNRLTGDIKEFSDGQKKKILLAKSLSTPAHLYIWDEPLNYIDIFSRLQIEQLLINSTLTILLAEHDNTFLNAISATKVQI